MTDPIGPGDWVECYKGPDCTPVTVGSVWRVSKIGGPTYWCEDVGGANLSPCDGVFLWLAGAPSPWPKGAWCSCGFRPIRSDITEIQRLLEQPIPAELVQEQTS